MDERITHLECRVAELEHLLHQLDDVVRAQADTIDRLGREVTELRGAPVASTRGGLEDERPPHFDRSAL